MTVSLPKTWDLEVLLQIKKLNENEIKKIYFINYLK